MRPASAMGGVPCGRQLAGSKPTNKKARPPCRAFPLTRSPVLLRANLVCQRTGQAWRQRGNKMAGRSIQRVLLAGHSGCRAALVMGFPSPSQVPPKRNRKPRPSPPVSGASFAWPNVRERLTTILRQSQGGPRLKSARHCLLDAPSRGDNTL